MTQGTEQGKQAIDRLVGLGHMRVWSVIITIFGDAVLQRGGIAAATTLSTLTEQMGVKPEAFRVALSRLTKDGWIVRSKKGRLSFYQLSDLGIASFGPATKRIYADKPGDAQGWYLVTLPNALGDEIAPDAVRLTGRSFLTQTTNWPTTGLVQTCAFTQIPDWVKTSIGTDEVAKGYRSLMAVLDGLESVECDPLEAAVLRVLIVHQWRRLVLRHADLPSRFFPDSWTGEACRDRVHATLSSLTPAADIWFGSAFSPAVSDAD